VIETAVGCDRLALALLCDAYRESPFRAKKGTLVSFFGLKPYFAPIKAAILPLSKKTVATDGG